MVAFLFISMIQLKNINIIQMFEHLRMKVNIMLMSGVEDGDQRLLDSDNNDGKLNGDRWSISIGRQDDNDIILQKDTFVSRHHAKLHYEANQWWVEDCQSTNGTFSENEDQFFLDRKVSGTLLLDTTLMFRVGRTWLKIKPIE